MINICHVVCPTLKFLNCVRAYCLQEELDLTAPNKAAMMDLPAEKKWQIYCSRKKVSAGDPLLFVSRIEKPSNWSASFSFSSSLQDVENATDLSQNPEQYIEKVRAMVTNLKEKERLCANENELAGYARLLDSLKTALRTQPNSYVLRFMEMDGLIHLLDALSEMDYDTAQSSVHTSLIGCVKALMNNSVSI